MIVNERLKSLILRTFDSNKIKSEVFATMASVILTAKAAGTIKKRWPRYFEYCGGIRPRPHSKAEA